MTILKHKTDGSKPVAQNWNGYYVFDGGDSVTISKVELAALKGKAADFMKLEAENKKLRKQNKLWQEQLVKLTDKLRNLEEATEPYVYPK